ncbi:MAG TPA: hypothetical protein VMP03_14865 [Methylomirabilota bacterium]|nr:hypothetical protein [Methylomirabilota bacterium]
MTSVKSREQIRWALGADPPVVVRATGHGPFGVLSLATELGERLVPSHGARRGRPTDPEWEIRRLVGFRRETWDQLNELAARASTPRRRVSPAQVAALLVEKGLEPLRSA